ncbi:hypothetical protein BDZ89DRAFT_363703 [Hymenopellis radicata]|nr:hypothetical protein BDZ89DRAFT_363703 [Hymenopellis radicata]
MNPGRIAHISSCLCLYSDEAREISHVHHKVDVVPEPRTAGPGQTVTRSMITRTNAWSFATKGVCRSTSLHA